MPTNPEPVREVPTVTLLRTQPGHDLTRPDLRKEPLLAVRNIQGNILAGFNKDHQVHLYLRILDGEVEAFRQWLGRLVPFIATTSEVLAFNRLFKEVRQRRGVETRTVAATWVNVALSFRALKLLAGDGKVVSKRAASFEDYRKARPSQFDVERFADIAFREGMAKRSVDVLSDPPDVRDRRKRLEGNRHNWLFGGPGNEADLVVIVGSDSAAELAAQVAQIEDTIYSGRTGPDSFAPSGVAVVYKQYGNTLPPPLTGHEHFGFLDGVSQPGIRGRISPDPHDVLTLRQNQANSGVRDRVIDSATGSLPRFAISAQKVTNSGGGFFLSIALLGMELSQTLRDQAITFIRDPCAVQPPLPVAMNGC